MATYFAFPTGFRWGVSTSSIQIEGNTSTDGRGQGIWESFSRSQGLDIKREGPEIACNHYNLYPRDVLLMKDLGVSSYRFSVSWPRIMPSGKGETNSKGLDFYDRLIDQLMAANIEPVLELYHWDLPQALQDLGGWTNRDIASWFAEYTAVVSGRYGDRVRSFIINCEAAMTSFRGHATGQFAPSISDRSSFFSSMHHQNVAQGKAYHVIRGSLPGAVVGTTLLIQPMFAASERNEDIHAAKYMDDIFNRAFLDPIYFGQYPESVLDDVHHYFCDGDLQDIRWTPDFLGVNYYSRWYIKKDDDAVLGIAMARSINEDAQRTAIGWEIYPEGLRSVLSDLRENYGNPVIYITENGCGGGATQVPDMHGKVRDLERIRFLGSHLKVIHSSIKQGSKVRGYFIWTLLDDWEFDDGYSDKFGLVYVDHQSQERVPKDSYYWYKNLIEANAIICPDEARC